jgi:hypothetical protein
LILIQSQTKKYELRNIYVTNVVYQFVSKVDFATTYYLLGNRYNVTYKRFLIKLIQIGKPEIGRNQSRNNYATRIETERTKWTRGCLKHPTKRLG